MSGEITYGLERLAMDLQGVESIYDLVWTEGAQGRVTYRDVFHQNEVEQSATTSSTADVAVLLRHFVDHEKACTDLLAAGWRCRPTSRCSRPRIPSICSMRGARSR